MLGFYIFILVLGDKMATIKKSKLVESFRAQGLSEGWIDRFLDRISDKAAKRHIKNDPKIKKLKAKSDAIDQELMDILKDTPEFSEKDREELRKRLGLS